MLFKRSPAVLTIAGLLAMAAGSASAAPIVVNSFTASSQVYNGSSYDNDYESNRAYGVRSLGSSLVGNSADMRIDAKDTGAGALFDFDFDQARTGTAGAYSNTLAEVVFTVGAANTSYALAGSFGMTGQANYVRYRAYLRDQSNGVITFIDDNWSRDIADVSFVLGTSGDGDQNSYTAGSMTGVLLAGHSYALTVEGFISAQARNDNGATSSGCVSFAVGGVALDAQCGIAAENAATQDVPEPGSLALAGLALAGLVGVRRRRR